MKIKFAVIGDPVAHSLSPTMHNPALKASGVDAVYESVHVTKEGLGEFVSRVRNGEYAGFNITVPHKKNIIPFLDETDPFSILAESVNTVSVSGGILRGCSTDGPGLERSLEENFSFSVKDGNIVFIGCGGAAHAAALYFASRGTAKISIVNRTLEKACDLCRKIKENYPDTKTFCCTPADTEDVRRILAEADTAIQATSLGLKPDDPPPFALELLPDSGLNIYDTIYRNTPIMKAAERKGLPHANGLGMLLHQGACSFEIWTGKKAPLEVMRKALAEAFAARCAG